MNPSLQPATPDLFRGLWHNLHFPQRPAFLFCDKDNGAAVCGLQMKQCQDVKLRFDARDVVNHA